MIEKDQEKSVYIKAKMQTLASLPIAHFRHQGMIHAFDVQTKNAQFSRDCYTAALNQGLLIRPIGNTVYFMPPYTINEAEIDFMVDATLNIIMKVI